MNTTRPMRVRTPRGSTTVTTEEARTLTTTKSPAANATTATTVPASIGREHRLAE